MGGLAARQAHLILSRCVVGLLVVITNLNTETRDVIYCIYCICRIVFLSHHVESNKFSSTVWEGFAAGHF